MPSTTRIVGAWIEVQSLLKSVVKRLDSNEKEVKDLKRRILTPTSSESGSSKWKVSPFVRVSTVKRTHWHLPFCPL